MSKGLIDNPDTKAVEAALTGAEIAAGVTAFAGLVLTLIGEYVVKGREQGAAKVAQHLASEIPDGNLQDSWNFKIKHEAAKLKSPREKGTSFRRMHLLLLMAIALPLTLMGIGCSSLQESAALGKFREASADIRNQYDVELGVAPVQKWKNGKIVRSVAGPFIVTEKEKETKIFDRVFDESSEQFEKELERALE